MKLPVLAFFFFLVGFITADPILDIDGKPVYNSAGKYYILPVMRGRGGGLKLADINEEHCPLTVVQAQYDLFHGLPVRFSSPLRILNIYTKMNLNIEFTEAPSCAPKPARWTVLDEKPSEKDYGSVKISDEFGFRGSFRIRESGQDYKLVHCSDSGSGEYKCIDLGIDIDDENKRRLVLKDGDPLVVRFKKADYEKSGEWSIV